MIPLLTSIGARLLAGLPGLSLPRLHAKDWNPRPGSCNFLVRPGNRRISRRSVVWLHQKGISADDGHPISLARQISQVLGSASSRVVCLHPEDVSVIHVGLSRHRGKTNVGSASVRSLPTHACGKSRIASYAWQTQVWPGHDTGGERPDFSRILSPVGALMLSYPHSHVQEPVRRCSGGTPTHHPLHATSAGKAGPPTPTCVRISSPSATEESCSTASGGSREDDWFLLQPWPSRDSCPRRNCTCCWPARDR